MTPLLAYIAACTAALVVFGYPTVAARRGLPVPLWALEPPLTVQALAALSLVATPALAWLTYSWLHGLALVPVAALLAPLIVMILRGYAIHAAFLALPLAAAASIILYARL